MNTNINFYFYAWYVHDIDFIMDACECQSCLALFFGISAGVINEKQTLFVNGLLGLGLSSKHAIH